MIKIGLEDEAFKELLFSLRLMLKQRRDKAELSSLPTQTKLMPFGYNPE
jgi:hypothetical protein